MPCLIFLMPILRIDLLKAQKERFIGTLFTCGLFCYKNHNTSDFNCSSSHKP